MASDSYRTRGAIFVFLIGPPKNLTRHDGISIYCAVAEALGADDMSFRFQSGERQPDGTTGFSIQMERQSGREKLNIEISSTDPNSPIRLLFRYEWPASNQLFLEDFDAGSQAVFEALGADWQRVLAEARIRGQVDVRGGSGLTYLSDHLIRLTEKGHAAHGRLSFLGFKYETAAADFTDADQLANPKRDVSVEVLREDPRCLYLEVMSQWPQLAIAPDGTVELSPGRIRAFPSAPSVYLRNTITYLDTAVLPLVFRTDPSQG